MTDPGVRLGSPFGLLVDRDNPVAFMFEGTSYVGYQGDSVASALWAAGVRTISRSFKYKRRRGIFSHTGLDGSVLVQAGKEPNVPADRLALSEGLPPLTGQNYSGSLAQDRSAWIERFSRFLPVGFYYRSFFRPKGSWKVFEPIIRRRAGLGRLAIDDRHPVQTDKQYLFCDICIIGGGPAGLAAAAEAVAQGADVMIVEAGARLGGSLLFEDPAASVQGLAAAPANVRVLTSAIAQGLYGDNWVAVETRDRLYKVRARRVIVATGVFEQPIVFRNNDLPGVMLSSAALRLAALYGVRPGRRAVVCTVGDEGLRAALRLIEAGVDVASVADLREPGSRSALHDSLAANNVQIAFATAPYEAHSRHASEGLGACLAGVTFARFESGGWRPLPGSFVACDLLCLSGSFVPAAALACHAGARLAFDDVTQSLAVAPPPTGIDLAGAVRGIRDLAEVIADGRAAGHAAAAMLGLCPAAAADRPRAAPAPRVSTIVPHPRGKEFVDFDEDLTIADIRNAIGDGFTHIELLKRYSTAGMGPSQGKFSALATLAVAAETLGVPATQLGTTTVRPPFTGASFRLLAGRGFSPSRRTPIHERHLALGAQMMVAGTWHRPAFYGSPSEREQAIGREVKAVREEVGLIDVSTLGGIEISGPDAATFLDRVYASPHARQPIGRSRYALLCETGGAVADDGVACRLADTRFYLTATTNAVDQTYRTLLWLNAQWRMKVDLLNVTTALAAINVAGPQSRKVLEQLDCDFGLAASAFQYLDVRVGRIAGIPVRVVRVGFVGELGFEIHVPAPYAVALWDRLMEAGRFAGIRPFGVEAQRVLRLEKGHAIIGQDTDGLTSPYEASLEWAIGKTKTDYVGRAAIEFRKGRGLTQRLVGFRLDGGTPAPAECCLVLRSDAIVGRVTSAVASQTCDGVIGLAFVASEDSAPGSTFTIKNTDGRILAARVVPTPFYDPTNERQTL